MTDDTRRSASPRAEVVPSDEAIDALLIELDVMARDVDRFEYGLPIETNPDRTNLRGPVRSFIGKHLATQPQQSPARTAADAPADIAAMVDRFLGWRLPDTFGPDCYIHFDRDRAKASQSWPIGTNLLTATEARAMLEYVVAALATIPAAPAAPSASEGVLGEPVARCSNCGHRVFDNGGHAATCPQARRRLGVAASHESMADLMTEADWQDHYNPNEGAK